MDSMRADGIEVVVGGHSLDGLSALPRPSLHSIMYSFEYLYWRAFYHTTFTVHTEAPPTSLLST
jgi:hypothetical protein